MKRSCSMIDLTLSIVNLSLAFVSFYSCIVHSSMQCVFAHLMIVITEKQRRKFIVEGIRISIVLIATWRMGQCTRYHGIGDTSGIMP